MDTGQGSIIRVGGLPVNGLKAFIKFGRTAKLPFAEDGPKDSNSSDRRSDDDKDSYSGALGLGGTRLG